MKTLVVCVDFGSTFTKALLVDVDAGVVVAAASHRTTIETDALDGWRVCLAELAAQQSGAERAEVLACSSAGGGLRIAVVGNEELVTAEAGRRVALSSGGNVVHVASGIDAVAIAALLADAPDLVLLVGGTDGGNEKSVVSAAAQLVRSGWQGPVVFAGNVDAAPEVSRVLADKQIPHQVADNVVPRIGVLRPDPARAAIRSVFLSHVIGGKHLSASDEFLAIVRGATPDVVLRAVELLAEDVGDVVVVDVGGATTDVHSVVEIDPEDAGLARQVVAPTRVSRTVEGDLGMRWSAISTVAVGSALGLVEEGSEPMLAAAALVRQGDPAHLPTDDTDQETDHRIAELAVGAALRRHAGRHRVTFGSDGRLVERSGKDLRAVDLLVGSGGVLRSSDPVRAAGVLRSATGDDISGGWLLPRDPDVVLDGTYVLAAAGLLAASHPWTARALLRRYVANSSQM